MRVTGRPVTEPAGTAVGRLRTCGSSAVIASRIAGTGPMGPPAVDSRADPPGTQKSRRRPIFPKGCPLSIFGAGELNFRVRDGNGCGLSARVTGILRVWIVSAAARRDGPSGSRGAPEWSSIYRVFILDLITIHPSHRPLVSC